MTNTNVARDEETQAMRRRMNRLLLIVLAGFALLWAGVTLVQSAESRIDLKDCVTSVAWRVCRSLLTSLLIGTLRAMLKRKRYAVV
ncbi:hypothetical protein [Mesorhizobium muleiense]|uniref:hypothetical protein n=1 Tax=Mesorhizobium muleiense TaxID=1004279 RepID=UPI001F1F824E|nr:hypothetical protein [Mesorhizobium muleiense]MCF6109823.1 hypothetical protein [Mesorhizobium muleiense]